jgi:hypothetical protein
MHDRRRASSSAEKRRRLLVADQKLVDAVHLHAQEESGQQRSEEETFTLPIRGCSTWCITTRRRRANSSQYSKKKTSTLPFRGWLTRRITTRMRRTNSRVARRDVHYADQRLVDAVHHHVQEENDQ